MSGDVPRELSLSHRRRGLLTWPRLRQIPGDNAPEEGGCAVTLARAKLTTCRLFEVEMILSGGAAQASVSNAELGVLGSSRSSCFCPSLVVLLRWLLLLRGDVAEAGNREPDRESDKWTGSEPMLALRPEGKPEPLVPTSAVSGGLPSSSHVLRAPPARTETHGAPLFRRGRAGDRGGDTAPEHLPALMSVTSSATARTTPLVARLRDKCLGEVTGENPTLGEAGGTSRGDTGKAADTQNPRLPSPAGAATSTEQPEEGTTLGDATETRGL